MPRTNKFLLTIAGRELTTQEIRDALIPYLETLLEEHGDILVNLVESFSSAPGEERTLEIQQKPSVVERLTAPISPPNTVLDTNHLDTEQQRALARVSDNASEGKLPPHILYLMDLGMEIEVIRQIIKKFPAFSYYTLHGKIKPLVDFLLDVGVPKSDIPIILGKRPSLCGISLTENLIPTMGFLEDLGVDKKQWGKVIHRFPALLTYSRPKLKATVDFLYEMGVSSENVGKILTRYPKIVSYNVEDKLRPTAEYFCSLGVDVAVLLARGPQNFGLSIEANLKPVTEFFLERGYTIGDVGTMISRNATLYTCSLSESLVPKWDYFLTMDYPNSELIKFPQYFSYSLVGRIQPRYEIVKKSGVRLLLNQVLSLSDRNFDIVLKKKLNKSSNG